MPACFEPTALICPLPFPTARKEGSSSLCCWLNPPLECPQGCEVPPRPEFGHEPFSSHPLAELFFGFWRGKFLWLAIFPPTVFPNYRVFKNYRVLQGGPKNHRKKCLKTKYCAYFFTAKRHRLCVKASPFMRKLVIEASPFMRG